MKALSKQKDMSIAQWPEKSINNKEIQTATLILLSRATPRISHRGSVGSAMFLWELHTESDSF